jgi:hypothetical protein
MPKIKPKESFKDLSIANAYQGLHHLQYEALMQGKTIQIDKVPDFIIDHVEILKGKQNDD